MKISIIGAGQVGSTTAFLLALKELADEVVMVDLNSSVLGKALDMNCCSPLEGFRTKITGSTDYSAIRDSAVVVITAGLARTPGMSREDLLLKNKEIVEGVASKIKEYSPEAVVIVVTNPLDVMAYIAWKASGFPKQRVMGMAGTLDSARLKYFLGEELKTDPHEIEGLVLGAHGDSMVAMPSLTKIGGKAVDQHLSPEKLQKIIARTQNCGAEIVNLLKTGSAYYSPASSVVTMVQSVIKDEKKIVPCSVCVEGEYGYSGIFLGLPAILGKDGVEKIIEYPLAPEAKALLNKSAEETLKIIQGLAA